MKRINLAAMGLFGVFLAAAPVWAHHSIQAEFYMDKEWTQTGVLTKLDWINPHTVTWIEVKNEQTGKTEEVGCQGGPPNRYSRQGLSPSDWKIGEVVTVTCNPAKNGVKTWGFLKSIEYHSDGHVLVMGQHRSRRY
jgi:hypothetical protein